jgi:hypothetical protein
LLAISRAASSTDADGSIVIGSGVIMSSAVEANALRRRSSKCDIDSRNTIPPNSWK